MPELRLDLNAFLEFFGIWITEVCLLKDCTVLVATRVKETLEKNNKMFRLECNNKSLTNYMNRFNVGADNKFLPGWVWKLNQEQCRILIDSMMLGDGYQMKATSNILYKTSYKTSSIQLADDFQRLCLHAGYSCNITLNYETYDTTTIVNGTRKGETVTSVVNSYRMLINTSHNEPQVNKCIKQDKLEKYKGKVYCCSVPSIHPKKNKDKTVKEGGVIYVRRQKYVAWSGNSVHGQKGTIGLELPCTDMPFTSNGLQPDIIMNPNAIPSRMTAGQLIECLHAKAGALEGMTADGTPFEETNLTPIEDILEKHGFNRKGKEYLYNGMTGYIMPVMIFIGPTYYMRLKHLVEDKIHSRARGPVSMLTRQAPEGRARDGGLRMGEMERDALIAHGIALFAKEKLLDNSDAYKTYVCGKCGLFAQRFVTDDETSNSYYCAQCNNHNNINKVIIPYAFKLLIQECMAMCVAPRLRFKKEF